MNSNTTSLICGAGTILLIGAVAMTINGKSGNKRKIKRMMKRTADKAVNAAESIMKSIG